MLRRSLASVMRVNPALRQPSCCQEIRHIGRRGCLRRPVVRAIRWSSLEQDDTGTWSISESAGCGLLRPVGAVLVLLNCREGETQRFAKLLLAHASMIRACAHDSAYLSQGWAALCRHLQHSPGISIELRQYKLSIPQRWHVQSPLRLVTRRRMTKSTRASIIAVGISPRALKGSVQSQPVKLESNTPSTPRLAADDRPPIDHGVRLPGSPHEPHGKSLLDRARAAPVASACMGPVEIPNPPSLSG